MATAHDQDNLTQASGGPQTENVSREDRERVRTLTEKGVAYNLDVSRRNYRSAISAWRKAAGQLSTLLTETEDIATLRRSRTQVEEILGVVEAEYNKYCSILSQADPDEKERLFDQYDAIERDHFNLMGLCTNVMLDLEEAGSMISKRSSTSNRGHGSRVSHRSQESAVSMMSRQADIAAKAAALKAELRYIEAEAKQRAEAERLRTLKEIDVAEARFKAIAKLASATTQEVSKQPKLPDVPDGRKLLLDQYLQSVEKKESLPDKAVQDVVPSRDDLPNDDQLPQKVTPAPCEYLPIESSEHGGLQLPEEEDTGGSQVPERCSSAALSQVGSRGDLVHLLRSVLNAGRLPMPEPGVFTGDPLEYPGWKESFGTLIERKGIPPPEKIHFLRRYLGGPAKQAVEGFLLLSNGGAFEEAKALLDQRYGDPFLIAKAFRDKLERWPRVPPRDGTALRSYGDFLGQCEVAMKSIDSLNVLNDDRENQKMLQKLPDWVVARWGRVVFETKETSGTFPTFHKFVKFITKEADIACDPVTSLQGLKVKDRVADSDGYAKKKNTRTSGARALTTSAGELKKKTEKVDMDPCICCGKGHDVDTCKVFLKKSVEERKDMARDCGLCFGCLRTGHRSKFCKNRKTCQICSKRHPTSLHGNTGQPANVSQSGAGSSRKSVAGETDGESSILNKADQAVASVDGPTQPGYPVGWSTADETAAQVHWSGKPRPHVSQFNSVGPGRKCSLTVPVWVSHSNGPGVEVLTYALLDTQSDTTFILQETCDLLGLQGPQVTLLLSTMSAESQRVESSRIEGLKVRGFDQETSKQISLPPAYTREIMPANLSHIPTPELAKQWPHLSRIANKLMPLSNCGVGMLIGYNCARALTPREVIPPVGNGPFAQRTDLGWGIVGMMDPDNQEDCLSDRIGVSHHVGQLYGSVVSFRTSIKEELTPFQVTSLLESDFRDTKGEDKLVSLEDPSFLAKLEKGIHQDRDQHYEIPLPFRGPEPSLPNNHNMAFYRIKQLERRFKGNPEFLQDYTSFMNDLLDRGYAERVPETQITREDGHLWYIPHHGVYHAKKKKIRIVFDCSARFRGQSLNDHLLQGPDQLNALVGVLCRFREEPVAFICDIKQMFHQFRVSPEHRDYLRFIWWDAQGTLVPYRMKVHIFGAVSSPGCAAYGLRQVVKDHGSEFDPEVSEFVLRNFYVDDGLKSVQTSDVAVSLISQTKALCAKGGLQLHKFVSSSASVIDAVPEEDRTTGLASIEFSDNAMPIERALGIQWCISSDSFPFRITLKDSPLTRRGVLSTVCSVYDPLGFIAPIILVGKQILQEMCRSHADWDSPLPDELRPKWERWREGLFLLQSLNIPRCYKPQGFGELKYVQFHNFSDASLTGYGQCSYIRLVDVSDRVHCSLVMGKARVTPLRQITVPRLELNAAVVSVKVSCKLRRELDYSDASHWFWTDSRVVLGYIGNDARRFHIFVANRIQLIRDSSEPSQWHHVSTDQNPADEGSRGMNPVEFLERSRWLTGPDFLWEQDIPALQEDHAGQSVSQTDPEIRSAATHTTQSLPETDMLRRLTRFSDWHKLKRAVAVCLKLKSILLSRSRQGRTTGEDRSTYLPVQTKDLISAETEIVKLTQKESFLCELELLESLDVRDDADRRSTQIRKKSLRKSSSLYRLDPFLDGDGVMRVGGRLRLSDFSTGIKHPVILPRRHHITTLVIRYFHQLCEHQGRGLTTNTIRSNGFWIVGCSGAVAEYISKCVVCRKLHSQTQLQKMADLPQDRLDPSPPFTYSGVDLFGPWRIKGRREVKRYAVLFTCLASRAVHVEVASWLTTDSFINALRRFFALRGPIRELRCDRGTNFVGADNELRKSVEEMDTDQIRNFLLQRECDLFDFNMNFPHSSHMGGVWERQIRSIRRVLDALLNHAGLQLDDECLRTLMAEAAAVINSRPLTVQNLNDPASAEPLTPNHLLTMKSRSLLPPPGVFPPEDLYAWKRWRRVQHLANEFWHRWRREYLQNLQVRQRWCRPSRDMAVGDVVIIKEEAPRNQWPMAIIKEVFPGSDGHVRRVRLKVGDTYLERPIHKVVLLVESN